MYSYGPPHMAKQKQDDHLEHSYSSYVMIRDVSLKICQRKWMMGRSSERGLGISVLAAWHDYDDDDEYTFFEFKTTVFFLDVGIIFSVHNFSSLFVLKNLYKITTLGIGIMLISKIHFAITHFTYTTLFFQIRIGLFFLWLIKFPWLVFDTVELELVELPVV